MTQVVKIHAGYVATAKAIAQQKRRDEDVNEASEEAVRIRSAAQAEADRIVAEAQHRAETVAAQMQDMSDEALTQFMDVASVEKVAVSIEKALRCSQDLRADFDAFTPWMKEFVQAAVTKIVGALPPDEVCEGLLSEALAEIPERWDLIIRCHASKAGLIRDIVARNADLNRSIKDVVPDTNLKPEDCLIESNQGVSDVSVPAKLVSLLYAIDTMDEVAR